MMIFSEIYGAYYRIAGKLLSKRSVSEEDVYEIIRKEGFRDSALFLPQKLLPQSDGSDWKLLKKNTDGKLIPITQNAPPRVLTGLQKMWLKAKLSDPRFCMFFEDGTLRGLSNKLSDAVPLYKQEHFRYFDKFSNGDDFSSKEYQKNFRAVLSAVKSRELLKIVFVSRHNRRIGGVYLPLKIEYSEKNDKLRALCCEVKNGKFSSAVTLNIGRIRSVIPTGKYWRDAASMEDYFEKSRAAEPVTVRVATERNAVERFLTEFADYEKRTERDLKSGSCTVSVFYDKQDETELLIRLLGFGAAVEILSPADFRSQAAERVKRQAELLAAYASDNGL